MVSAGKTEIKQTGRPSVVLVAAVADNNVIGRAGGLPWRLSTDLKRFKALTMGRPIIMGRKTWDSLGRALPGRRNIVVTGNTEFSAPDAERAGSLDMALSLAAGDRQVSEVHIIGGGDLYRQAMAVADRLCITHVRAEVDGDTTFPQIDENVWKAVHVDEVPAGEKDIYPTRYVVYERA